MQQTYFMIKPEIVAAGEQKIGAILAIVNAAGFRITGLEMRQFDRPLVEDFYGEHEERPFFPELVEYIAGGPVVAIRLEDRGLALNAWQRLLESGVYCNLMLPPAAPEGGSVLRFSLSAAHTDEQVDTLIERISALGL